MDIKKTIKGIEISRDGYITSIRGFCKAKDFKKPKYSYADIKIVKTDDIMEVLDIRRLC